MRVGFTASVVLLMMTILCVSAQALDRDRSIGQFHSTFWSEKDGAPSKIRALAQSSDGYLWIASETGLFRFDGVRFERFEPSAGVRLPSYSIYALMPTQDGGLWIAFDPNSMGYLKNGSLQLFSQEQLRPATPVHCFAQDNDGTVWAGTESGLEFRRGDQWIPVSREWNFTPERVRYLFVDRTGTLWVATDKQVVYLKRGSKRFEVSGPVGSYVTTLSESPNHRVWFADNGEYIVRPVPSNDRKLPNPGPTISADGLSELLFDRDGALWMTRQDSGVIRIRDPEKLEPRKYGIQDPALESFGPKDGFSAGSANKIFEDREGNIWIGCSNGLIRFRHNQVVPVALPLRYERLTLFAGLQNQLWVGTISDKPILKISGETIVNEKGGNAVSSVLRDANGDIWWGGLTGIWRQQESAFKFFHLPKEEVPGWMWDLMYSSDDRGFWVKLGDAGLVRFNHGDWNLHDWPQGVPSAGRPFSFGPSASYRDPSGRFWLGYSTGPIYVIENGHPTVYSEKDGLALGRIKVIRGQNGQIWVGGELGLAFFSNGRFWRVQPTDGNPFGAISGIIATPDSGLWLNEMNGIVQIPREEIQQLLADPSHRVLCRRFDYLDGLPGSPQMSFADSTAVMTTDRRLWFATDKGLASIDPAHLTTNPLPPPVSIVAIASDNMRHALSGPINFAPKTHTVEIDYTALSLSIPERVHFRYKLDRVDAVWQDVGTRRQANYSNLAPGNYAFHVIACNNDGVWNNAGATVTFTILPTFFQTIWFTILLVLLVALSIWGLYALRLKQATAEIRVRLNERHYERERIARELHDTLLQDFQAVILRFQIAAKRTTTGDPSHAVLEEGLNYADKVLAEGRDYIRDIRADSKAFDELSESLAEYGNELSKLRTITFSIKVTGTKYKLDPIFLDEIHRIGREAIANAFNHSNGTKVEVEIIYQHSELQLKVYDDGIGMDPNLLNGGRPGHWGIRNMQERAQKIGATLTISSQLGAGTLLELKCPARSAQRARSSSRSS